MAAVTRAGRRPAFFGVLTNTGGMRAGRNEILPFTALRGLAAWWVAIYHFDTVLPLHGVFERFIVNGPLAVDLFFIMSGFVMALCYGATFRDGVGLRDYGRFMGVRLARIYPLHLLVLVLFLSVPFALAVTGREPLWGHFEPDYFLASLMLIQNWRADSILDWNVPAWSISTEMLFYLVFPIVSLLASRLVRGAAACVAAMAAILLLIGLSGDGASYTLLYNPLRCLPECVLGMLLFRLASLLPLDGRASLVPFGVAVALFGADAAGVGLDQGTMPLAFTCLLWSVLAPGFWVSRVLSWRPLLWIGEVSFSTYMIHFLVKYWVKFLLVGRVPTEAVFVVYVALVLVASAILHALVEVPGRRIGRRLTMLVFAKGTPARVEEVGR